MLQKIRKMLQKMLQEKFLFRFENCKNRCQKLANLRKKLVELGKHSSEKPKRATSGNGRKWKPIIELLKLYWGFAGFLKHCPIDFLKLLINDVT